MYKPRHIVSMIFAAMLVASPAFAGDASKNMKSVMQQLTKDMQTLFGHIMKDEFEEIEKYAEKVANHDEPPVTHRLRIIGSLGTSFPAFKAHDDNVHINAMALKKAASERNIEGVLSHYAKVTSSCNDCHKEYRKQIQELNL